jgi:hypothetical protein
MAGGSCQEMGPAVDFVLLGAVVRPAVPGPNNARRPEPPFPATHRRIVYGSGSGLVVWRRFAGG